MERGGYLQPFSLSSNKAPKLDSLFKYFKLHAENIALHCALKNKVWESGQLLSEE